MIQFMINFANNFDADCRDGFVSNDHAYTEKAIEGVDLDKKLKKWCEENSFPLQEDYPFVDMLVDFARSTMSHGYTLSEFDSKVINVDAMKYIIIYAKV